LWKKEKRKFRLNNNQRVYGKSLAWRQWIYLQQTHLEFLPSLIYLPVTAQHLIKTPPWDWQSRLYIGIIDPLPIGQKFSLRQAVGILRNHFNRRSQFPLIKSRECPILDYLHILSLLGVIQKQSKGQYIKLKTIPFHRHIEAALVSDDVIMDELILKIRNKKQA